MAHRHRHRHKRSSHEDTVPKSEYDGLKERYEEARKREEFYKDKLKKSKSISDEDIREHALFKELQQKCQELQAQVSDLRRENALLQTRAERFDDIEWRYRIIADIVQEQKQSGRISD